MKITYNETEKCVEIKDGFKNHFLLMKVLMILNLANSILNLSDVYFNNFRFINLVWAILGTITKLDERTFMGKKKYFLELKNGKTRDLLEVKSDSEFKDLKKMFKKIGIQL